MVTDLYSAISKNDFDHVNELTEARLGSAIQKSREVNKKEVKFTPSEIPHIERKPEDQSYLFDKIFEKGVFFDREKNDTNQDYFLDKMLESDGIRYYQHKYFAGYDIHYYLDKYAEKLNDRASKYQFKYFAEERNRSMVLRVYGVFKDLGRFTSNGVDVSSHDYTGNHMVILENQLQEPPVIALTDPNIEKWVKRHKINHNNWKITDVDNYMKGNPFFKKMLDASDFKKFVADIKEKHIPKADDLSSPVSQFDFE